MKVEQGTFATTLDTRLEAELIVALSRQPDLEVVSAGAAERALVRQRVCDPEHDFAACRVRQLGIAGDFLVELSIGTVPGSWVLTTAFTPASGQLIWLPTLPFTQQRGERLEDAVARVVGLLASSLGPSGLRPSSRFVAAHPAAGAFTEIASLCPQFNDPEAQLGELLWQTRSALRAQLHRVDREIELEAALADLAAVSKQTSVPCAQLDAIVGWQQRAVAQGWLPAELESMTWRANVDIQLRGDPEVSTEVSEAVGTSFAGALAMRGLTLHSIHPAAEPCAEGPGCVEGIDATEVRPRVWVLVVDIVQSPDALGLKARLLLPEGEKVRAVGFPKLDVGKGTLLKPAIDSAVAQALK